jgi:hypothetical protein
MPEIGNLPTSCFFIGPLLYFLVLWFPPPYAWKHISLALLFDTKRRIAINGPMNKNDVGRLPISLVWPLKARLEYLH